MNVALLIGLSNYKNIDPLTACGNDLAAMSGLLKSLDKYDDILSLNCSSSCYNAKQQIINYIERHKSSKIEEFMFYYSGHGDFDGAEFRYLWSDYQEGALNQTSLSNTEIDSYIKKLSPEMTFKIVDACQSGISYIKDNADYYSSLDKKKSEFNKCYFFFSSLATQSSFASQHISYFTETFLRFFNKSAGISVRYRDIKDFISDEFAANKKQTPFFIEQADNTEHFCTITEKTIQFIASQPFSMTRNIPMKSQQNFIDIVANDANKYCTKEEADALLSRMLKESRNYDVPEDIEKLFNRVIDVGYEFSQLPQYDKLARWIEKADNANFFMNIKKKKEARTIIEPKRDPFISVAMALGSNVDYVEVTRYVDTIEVMESTVEQEYVYIVIKLNPKYPNIDEYEIYMAVVLSQIDVAIFSGIAQKKRKGWDEFDEKQKEISWSFIRGNIRRINSDAMFFKNLIEEMYQAVIDVIKTKFTPEKKEEATPSKK